MPVFLAYSGGDLKSADFFCSTRTELSLCFHAAAVANFFCMVYNNFNVFQGGYAVAKPHFNNQKHN